MLLLAAGSAANVPKIPSSSSFPDLFAAQAATTRSIRYGDELEFEKNASPEKQEAIQRYRWVVRAGGLAGQRWRLSELEECRMLQKQAPCQGSLVLHFTAF